MKKFFGFVGVCLLVFVLLFWDDDSSDTRVVNYNGSKLMVSVDGVSTDSLPSEGSYYLVGYKCSSDNTLVSWDSDNYKLSLSNGNKKGNLVCNLKFKSKPFIADMAVGSYVSYVGTGGTVGEDAVRCKSDGSRSSAGNGEAESSNACSGTNAREDLDGSGYTYGYCSNSNFKFITTGFRIAYIDSSSGDSKAVLVSAGSPECVTRSSSMNNDKFVNMVNSKALKYCNSKFVDGDCSCVDEDNDGLCDSESLDAWSINDNDFYLMTKAISGYGKRLSEFSSSLGDKGGDLGNKLFCVDKGNYGSCGYNNDLIDNGGYYWFSSYDDIGIAWSSYKRSVVSVSDDKVYGIRPMISLSSSVYVVGGAGTMNDPYIISND